MRVRAKSAIVIAVSGLCALVQAQEPAKAPFDRELFAADRDPARRGRWNDITQTLTYPG